MFIKMNISATLKTLKNGKRSKRLGENNLKTHPQKTQEDFKNTQRVFITQLKSYAIKKQEISALLRHVERGKWTCTPLTTT